MPPLSYIIQIQPPDKTEPALFGSLLEAIKERISSILTDPTWEGCRGLRVSHNLDLRSWDASGYQEAPSNTHSEQHATLQSLQEESIHSSRPENSHLSGAGVVEDWLLNLPVRPADDLGDEKSAASDVTTESTSDQSDDNLRRQCQLRQSRYTTANTAVTCSLPYSTQAAAPTLIAQDDMSVWDCESWSASRDLNHSDYRPTYTSRG
ncbi:uncharacterized protein KY384_001365 [Bacidia gigantensis]|uniref:uncharacterized protein n=1 Tax=Bacidia gigantensis TaxID=2732470 RepID=UPI001D041B12|nr:uncharacterized protein KY384_001365 [Bacidia gigantensis]KAG8533625.1 hypothetical protein KY384_001365 [Bacidia gigantensis]